MCVDITFFSTANEATVEKQQKMKKKKDLYIYIAHGK